MMEDQPEIEDEMNGSYFTVRKVQDIEELGLTPYTVPWSNQFSRPISKVYDVYEGPGASDGEFKIVTEVMDDGEVEAYPWMKVNYASGPAATKSTPVSSTYKDMSQKAFMRHIKSFQNGIVKKAVADEKTDVEDKMDKKYMQLLYGNNGAIFMACFVRFLLMAHNILSVWRVTDAYDDNMYWLLVIANFFLILEGMVVIIKKAGMEYSWWCPCFLIYLASTIPAIWLLQLNQYDRFVNADKWTTSSPYQTTPTSPAQNITVENIIDLIQGSTRNATNASLVLTTASSGIPSEQTIEMNTTVTTTQEPDEPVLGTLDNDVWVIIIEESLVYLLVFSRWLLPRGKVSRDFLADLLLEFLAIASDIMELLAVFDQDEVRGNLKLTYTIMAVWSASFIQFIPILMQKKRFRKVRNPKVGCLTRYCGEQFTEIVVTCMSIFLQDLPFLVVRLYIIIEVNLITYSLIFFLLKNIVTLMLLSYRLSILCYRLPHCKGKPASRRRS